MKTSRTLASVGAALLLALLAPLGADARPPQPAGSAAPQASLLARPPSIAGAHLAISQLTSAPTRRTRGPHVRRSRRRSSTRAVPPRAAASSSIFCASAAGRSRSAEPPVDLAAHDSTGFSVRVRLPRALRDGSYALVACARRARAERRARVRDRGAASPDRVAVRDARPRLRRRFERGVLLRRTFVVAVRSTRLPGNRQRRLHERPHGRLPELRHRVEPVPSGNARRARPTRRRNV